MSDLPATVVPHLTATKAEANVRRGSIEAMHREASTAIDVISNLHNIFPIIATITLAELTIPSKRPNKSLTASPRVKGLNDEAIALRKEYNVPFWIALSSVAQKNGEVIPPELLQASSFHQPMIDARQERVVLSFATAQYLEDVSAKVADGNVATISSRVTLQDGAIAHIPMLDFRLEPSPSNQKTVESVISHLGIGGVILDSGQSYHYYGACLLSDEELREFLGRALLFTPVVDYRWIAHQLIEGACALRFSHGVNDQAVPSTVAIIESA